MSEYFSHDYDARNDEKIISLLSDMEWEGYGLYWGLVELLYQNDGYMRLQYERIAYALRTDADKVKRVINEYDLFVIEGGDFCSKSIINRLNQRNDKSEKARQSAFKRWENANAKRTQSDGNAIKESKVKERKENKEDKEFVPPSLDEVKQFFKENEYEKRGAEKAYYWYNDRGWKNAKGKQVLNWKSTMRNNWFKPEYKLGLMLSKGPVL